MEIIQSAQQKEKQIKNEDSLRDLWDIQCTNICIIGVPEGEERKKKVENRFDKIVAKNLLKLKKETDIQGQETQRIPNKVNLKRLTSRHIMIKMAKVKDREF